MYSLYLNSISQIFYSAERNDEHFEYSFIFYVRKKFDPQNGLNYDLIMLIDAYVKCFVAQFIPKPYLT